MAGRHRLVHLHVVAILVGIVVTASALARVESVGSTRTTSDSSVPTARAINAVTAAAVERPVRTLEPPVASLPPATAPAGSEAPPDPPPAAVAPYRVTPYTIRSLARDAVPYATTKRLPWKTNSGPQDRDGIPMKRRNGKLGYSPTGLAQFALRFEDAYRRSGDKDYLAVATKVERKLMAMAHRSGDAAFIPYDFDFAMHHIPNEVMRAPWYSAMAQGLALSLAVRLHLDTGNPRFLADARLLFNSFRHLGRGARPWVAYVDPDRYLWLEEYPERWTPSDHTANGFNFALFGLYDYLQATHDPVARELVQASLTTMRHYIGAFRRPGTFSKYCLRHDRPQAKYHIVVTEQLVYLYRISGDSYFLKMSKLFRQDYS